MSTQRPLFANIQVFVRAALWIFIYTGASFYLPELRNFPFLLICWLAGVIISFIFFFIGGERNFGRNLFISKRNSAGNELSNFSLPLYAGDSINTISLFADRYLVGAFLGTESAGVYSFYSSVALGAYNLANSGVMQVMRPKLVKLYFERRDDDYALLHKECMKKSLLSVILLCLSSAITLSLALPYVSSSKISNNLGLSYVLLIGVIARIASDVQGYVFYTREADSTFTKTVVFAAVILVALNLILIPTLGLYGAAIAFFLTYLSTYVLRTKIISGVERK
jgi:O-antigen/teichoic acid export membrane protein